MAVITLGNFVLNIGGTPQLYSPFPFRDDRAYLIKGSCVIQIPENIFSTLQIRGIFTNSASSDTYTHHLFSIPITTRPFVFLLPFSGLYDGDGDVTLEVERIPNIPGAGDSGGDVTLSLEYDDANTARTWL